MWQVHKTHATSRHAKFVARVLLDGAMMAPANAFRDTDKKTTLRVIKKATPTSVLPQHVLLGYVRHSRVLEGECIGTTYDAGVYQKRY